MPVTLLAFVVLVVLAGGNAPAIRYVSCATCELDPFWGAAMRFVAAGAIFAVIALVLRAGMPRGRALTGALIFGLLQFGAGFGLIYWGLVRAPAGVSQVLIASVPLLTFGLALVHRQERYRWEGLAGASLAITGIAITFGNAIDTGIPLRSMLAILAGAACWAEALVLVKRFPPVHPATMNAIAMLEGGVMLLVVALISGEQIVVPSEVTTWRAQIYLIALGSIAVFWLYLFVVRHWTASAASYQLVLIPLVTVPVSASLQDEQITWLFAAGAVLVVAGVYIGAIKRPATRGEPVAVRAATRRP